MAIAFIRYATGDSYPNNSDSVQVAVTAGNLVVLSCFMTNPDTTATPTSTGETWTHDARVVGGPDDDSLDIWSTIAQSTKTMTVNLQADQSGTMDLRTIICVYSGAATTGRVEDTSTGTGTGTAINAGTLTTLTAGALLYVTGCTNSDGQGWNPGSGYTFRDDPNKQTAPQDPDQKIAVEDKLAGAPGNYAANMTINSDSWIAAGIVYKSADGGGDTTPPTLTSAIVGSTGTSLTLSFSEPVQFGASGNGGWTLSPSGGAATLTYSSGSGTAVLVYTISRAIQAGETATVSYTQPGAGVVDLASNPLATLSGRSVTNNSTVGLSTTHWASSNGSASWAACRGDTDPGVYCSLTTANNNAQAGDTVILKSGTYSTGISPTYSGTSGSARITYRNTDGIGVETVTIITANPAVNLIGRSFITVLGIKTSGMAHHLYIRSSSNDNIIGYCSFDNNNAADWNHSILDTSSQRNWIHHCQFSKSGENVSTPDDIGTVLDVGTEGDTTDHTWYNLIEDCTLFHGGHNILSPFSGRNTYRRNYLHNEAWSLGYGNRCTSTLAGSGEPYGNIYEDNRFGYSYLSIDNGAVGSLVILSSYNLIRFNSVYHSSGYGLALSTYSGFSACSYNRIYNNTIFNNGLDASGDASAGAYIFTYTGTPPANNALKNNLYYQNGTVYAGDRVSAQTYANEFTVGDPLFINASTTPPADKTNKDLPDLHLSTLSPALLVGGPLTTVAAAGSGLSMTLADARYFQDGSYAPSGLVDADWIAVGTVNNIVQITSIDYSTGVIGLSSNISRSADQSVWLHKKSNGEQVLPEAGPYAGAYGATTEGPPVGIIRLGVR